MYTKKKIRMVYFTNQNICILDYTILNTKYIFQNVKFIFEKYISG